MPYIELVRTCITWMNKIEGGAGELVGYYYCAGWLPCPQVMYQMRILDFPIKYVELEGANMVSSRAAASLEIVIATAKQHRWTDAE